MDLLDWTNQCGGNSVKEPVWRNRCGGTGVEELV